MGRTDTVAYDPPPLRGTSPRRAQGGMKLYLPPSLAAMASASWAIAWLNASA